MRARDTAADVRFVARRTADSASPRRWNPLCRAHSTTFERDRQSPFSAWWEHVHRRGLANSPPPPDLRTVRGPLALSFSLSLATSACEHADHELLLERGDTLVFYADGVTETRHHGQLFGEDRDVKTVCSMGPLEAPAITEGLNDQASRFAGRLRDDLQLLVLRLADQSVLSPTR